MWTTAERRTTISLSPPTMPRLRLQPLRSTGTPLDGGWWPRSDDPVAELPGLILAIDDRFGPVTRIMLRTADWGDHPRRLRVAPPGIDRAAGHRVVRLGWFDTMPAGLLTALAADGRRADLVTIPPRTGRAAAQAAMEMAAHPRSLMHTPELLSATIAFADLPEPLEAEMRPESIW